MGATANLKSIRPEVLAILLDRPHLIESFVCCYPSALPPGLPEALRQTLKNAGLVGKVDAEMQEWLREDAPDVAEMLLSEALTPHLYLEKAWESLASCLAELSPSESVARCVFGGKEVGPNLGYAPARFLTPEEVTMTAEVLASLNIPDSLSTTMVALLRELKSYYADAALNRLAILQNLA